MWNKFKKYTPSLVFLVVIFLLTTLFFALPKADYSENEKRILAEPPTASVEAFLDGTMTDQLEDYLTDHFPARDFFVGVNAYYEWLTGRGGAADIYLCKDGYLIGAEGDASAEAVTLNTSNYAAFAEYLGLNATLMVVPSTGYIMEDKLPAVHMDYTDDELFEAAEKARGQMTLIDLRESFKSKADQTQLYYKTDHHLTADGSYELYSAYLQTVGKTPKTDYRIETYNDFYGTLYSRGGFWLTSPDTIELWINDDLDVRVEISNGIGQPDVYDSMYFYDHLDAMDKYPLYLNGNNGLVKITNPQADGGKLLIVKDSFAHCAATMLAQHYSEIYMVDLRYYSDSADLSVAELVQQNNIEDALFLYGVDSLSTERQSSFKLFSTIEDAFTAS